MLFSETERQELAAFFAKRFTDPSVRTMLARQAGVAVVSENEETGVIAWESLIEHAQRKRRLPHLATVAARTDQTDQNLQAVCNLLGARARVIRNRAMAVGLAASIALVFGFGGWMLGGADLGPVASNLVPTVVTNPTAPPIQETQLDDNTALATTTEVEVEIEPVIDAGPAYVKNHTPPTDRQTGPAWRQGRCTYDNPGDFIGYWYGGRDLPGKAGETITIGLGVNVRTEYPDHNNGFNKRGTVRCILKRGDTVKLSSAPVLVPGDHFWVPLYHGDIVEEAPEEASVAVR